MLGCRRAAVVVVVAVAAATAGGLINTPRASAIAGQYSVVASASGGSVTYDIPDFLIVSTVGGGAPTAQVTLDSTRGSYGFASSPYPGDAVVGLPPTVRGLAGAPLPDYPLYVTSRSPAVPKDERSAPGYLIRSESSDTSSAAVAKSGLDDPNAAGASSTAQATARVTDTASTASSLLDIQSFRLRDVLSVGRVKATAKVVVDAAGKVTLSSSFDVLQTTVAGQALGITPAGLVVAGQAAPLPDASPVVQALKAAGITLEYLAPIETSNSVVSAGVRITLRAALPPQVPGVGGVPVTATYVLGQAVASTRAQSDPLPLGTLPLAGTPTVGAARPPAQVRPLEPAATDGGKPAPADVLPPQTDGQPDSPVVAGDPASGNAALVVDGSLDAAGFYLVLVVAAFAALTGATLWRLLGVRNLWT